MAAVSKGDFGSSIFTLIQEQLGLKLEPLKLPLDMVIVDKRAGPHGKLEPHNFGTLVI